jgi:hypothetical protein
MLNVELKKNRETFRDFFLDQCLSLLLKTFSNFSTLG